MTWSSRCPTARPGRAPLWAGYEHFSLLAPNPAIEVDQGPSSRPPAARRRDPGARASATESTRCTSRRWPRIDDAIESYALFKALRDEGVIPSHVRFQVEPAVPDERALAFQGQLRRATSRSSQQAYEELFAREVKRLTDGDPPRRPRHPVGRLLGGARPRGRHRLDGRRRLGALRRPGLAHDPADPGGDARRLPPLLRHVPDLADVRGAGHGAAREDGELRRRELRAHRGLAAPRGPA